MLRSIREFLWIVLFPLSFLWALVASVRRKFFCNQGYTSRFPVICVGNIHSGGTGKTPIVAAIANHYIQKNSLIVSRGYKRKSREKVLFLDPMSLGGPQQYGDEPWLLSKKTGRPVYVGGKRKQVAKVIESAHATGLLILDDGYQHFGLKKSVSIIVVNSDQSPLTSFCLPLGDLREPLSALAGADAFVLVDSGSRENCILWKTYLESNFAFIPLFSAVSVSEELSEENLKGKVAFAFCGIAHPERFITSSKSLRSPLGVQVYPDHYGYSEEEVDRLIKKGRDFKADYFLTTEKDFYKVQPFFAKKGQRLAFLKHQVILSEGFWGFLDSKVAGAA